MIYYTLMFFLYLFVFFHFRKKGIAYPANYISFIFSFYFVIKYFLYVFFDLTILDGLSFEDLNRTGYYLFIFSLFMVLSFLLPSLGRKSYVLPKIHVKPRLPMWVMGYGLLILTVLFLIVQHGPGIFLNPLEIRNLMTKDGMYYFAILQQLTMFGYSLWLLQGKRFVSLGCFSIAVCFFSFISGRASLQTSYLINLFFFAGIYWRAKVGKYLLIIFPVLLAYVIITGIHRDMAVPGISASLDDVVQNVLNPNVGEDLIHIVLTRMLHRIDQLESLTLLINDLDYGNLQYSYGRHMIEIVFQWVPRSFWVDKPINFTSLMTSIFRPNVSAMGAANNFSGIGEAIYNFALPGCIIFGSLCGLLTFLSSVIWENAHKSFAYASFIILVIYPSLGLTLLAGFINDLALPSFIVSSICYILMFRIRIEPVTS